MCRLNINWNIGTEQEDWAGAVDRLELFRVRDLAGVLCRALHDETHFRHVLPDEQERVRLLPAFFDTAIRTCLQYGEAFTTETCDSAALWIGPDGSRRSCRITGTLSANELGPNLNRCMTLDNLLDEVRNGLVTGSHWHLIALAVAPSMQRTIGTKLIEPILARADSDNLPCYLETFNETNMTFYRQHGFRIAAAGNIPGGGPDFWAMIRVPQFRKAAWQLESTISRK